MRKTLLAVASAGLIGLPMLANAEDAAPAAEAAPTPDNVVTANVGLFSQYVFRGLTQTNARPAIRGGIDYSHSSGVYAGLWGSNISWLRDANAYRSGGSLELDLYGGYKGSIGDTGIGYDVGLLYYYYPGEEGFTSSGARLPTADTLEAYVGLSWKWLSLKYSNSLLKNTFGVANSSGTDYIDFSVAVPILETGLTAGAHYGIQRYRGSNGGLSNNDAFSYDDWRVSLAYDLGKATSVLNGTEVGVVYTDTSGANVCGYGSTSDTGVIGSTSCTGVYPSNIAKSQTTVYIKRTF